MGGLLGLMPTIICVLFACTHTQKLGDTAAHNEWLTITITTKARCKIHPCPHIQANIMFTLNTIIIVPQLHRPQISSFGHLVHDYDNLTPSLNHSSHLSHLYCVIRVFSQYPHSLSHPIIRGPLPHRMLSHMKYSP